MNLIVFLLFLAFGVFALGAPPRVNRRNSWPGDIKHSVAAKNDEKFRTKMLEKENDEKFRTKMLETVIFSGSSNEPLAKKMADKLRTSLGKVDIKQFADGEINIKFKQSLRGKDVYIVQPTSTPVNDHLMELLLMISTCRRASANKITAVVPYYGYARQDRKLSSRVPISAADVARMIEAMGVDRVISVDLHCGQIQGFFGPHVPVDNLGAYRVALDHFVKKGLKQPVIVSPDAGGIYRVTQFQKGLEKKGLESSFAMLSKQRAGANIIGRMDLVGSVEGADCIIVDDIIDTGGTLAMAAGVLKTAGAKRVFAFITHGLFNGEAIKKIEKSELEEVVVTDSIKPRPDSERYSTKITRLSISTLLADAIRRIHLNQSLHDEEAS